MSSKPSKRLSQKILQQFVPKLRESIFYKEDFRPVLLKTVELLDTRKIEQIICYGLGSFHDGTEIASRYQLALLLLIYEELVDQGAPISNVIEIFDPSFEPLDLETLKTFSQVKFQMIDENEHCARKIESNTLIYMPHLDKHFYNNLIGANWHVDYIDRLVILGNSFQAMIDFETSTACRTNLHYIDLLVNNFKTSEKEKFKRLASNSYPIGQREVQEPGPLIELIVECNDMYYWEVFNNFAFHFMRDTWIKDNKGKIDQHRLLNWDKVVTTNSDTDWNED